MKTHKLSAEKRDVVGKKVKHLRKKGLIPANIFGKTVKSAAISLNSADFHKTYNEVGETGLIELNVNGEKEPHHVLVSNVQTHPVTEETLHVDLHQVALKEKIQVAVPLTFEGEAPAVTQKKGVLITLLNEAEVEALPTELPEELTVDLSTLNEVGDEIKISDLKVPARVKIVTDPEEAVVRINPQDKEEEPAPAAEGTEAPGEGEPPATETPTATEETKE